MSEQNKNRNKDKGKQRNIMPKYDTRPKRDQNTEDVEISEETEFLNLDGKQNKRKRE